MADAFQHEDVSTPVYYSTITKIPIFIKQIKVVTSLSGDLTQKMHIAVHFLNFLLTKELS